MAVLRKLNAFIFPMAIALAVATVPSQAVISTGVDAKVDACCTQCNEDASHAADTTTGSPDDHDGCPSGCQGCFLPCCTGIVMFYNSSVALLQDLISLGSVDQHHDSFSSVNLREIFHPPRV